MPVSRLRFVRKYSFIISVVVALMAATAFIMNAADGAGLRKGNPDGMPAGPKIAVAYVEWFRKTTPDPDMFTHIIYSSAGFNDSCDAVDIPTPERLRSLARLKSLNPELKVILGVAGEKREGFSEMARDGKKRKSFARSVKAILDSLNLDGVDLDWEFPTTEAGGHTATPDDDRNYVKVVRELRRVLGKDKWISFYSNNGAGFIDFRRMVPHVDYVNVSGYNLSIPRDGERSYHQSPLYQSVKTGGWCVMKSVERHMEKGVPPEKILIGIPFYGRGKTPFPSYVECRSFGRYSGGTTLQWDDDAQAPYYADSDGNLVMGFDDERSIKAKFDFIRTNNLPGVFIWNYDSDYDDHRLGRTVGQLRK